MRVDHRWLLDHHMLWVELAELTANLEDAFAYEERQLLSALYLGSESR